MWAQNPFQRPLTPEQADFRGLLRSGSVRPSHPPPGKPETSTTANQLDFRGLLKKAPTAKEKILGGTTELVESKVLGVPSSLGSSDSLPRDASDDVFSSSPYGSYRHVDDSLSGDSKGGTVDSRGVTPEPGAASKSPFESPASKSVSVHKDLLSSTPKAPGGTSAGKKFLLISSKSEVCHLYFSSR